MKFLMIILTGIITVPAWGQGTLSVEVTNIKAATGSIRVALFDSEKDFLEKPLHGKVVKALQNKVVVHFENLPAGDFAISVIHDENENGDLDSNIMGIPKEGFGFGNDAMGMFGPPSFEKAKIKWDGKEKKVGVKLKYM